MKNVLLILLVLILAEGAFWFVPAQNNINLFDSTWTGYNTGTDGTGSFPAVSKLADMDNDGDSDIVVGLKSFAKGFTFMKNTGGGIFEKAGTFSSQKPTVDIITGDFNNDGRQDVVTGNSGNFGEGNSIALFLNLGNGLFAPAVNFPSGASPSGLAAMDLDLDGDLDIVVGNNLFSNATVSILYNNSNASFALPVPFPAGNRAYGLVIAKINNDNFYDIAVSSLNKTLNILFSNGGNDFSNRVEYLVDPAGSAGDLASFNISLAASDIDNDNDIDILYGPGKRFVGNYDHGSVALFRNQGNGIMSAPEYLEMIPFTLAVSDIETIDLNADGWKDIVIGSYVGRPGDGYMIFMNTGNGYFNYPLSRAAGQYTADVMTGDADNDNWPDILTLDYSSLMVSFHKNYGNANFPTPKQYPTNSFIGSFLDAADIDNDNDLDLLTSATGSAGGASEPSILKNNGDGSFQNGVIYSTRLGGVQAKLRDINGDKRPDIIFATDANSPPFDFHYALNNGDGTFGIVQTIPLGSCGFYDIDAFDLDNDGDLDVVLTENKSCPGINESGYRLYILINNGNAVFSPPVIHLSTTPFPKAMEGADFNEDGKIDIATGHGTSIDIHIGLGNGNYFLPSVPYPTDLRTFDLCVADFNGDDNLDIASCHLSDSESVNVMLGNGNGTFQPKQYYYAPASIDGKNQSGITSGDVDGDGDSDIILANGASNTFSIYLNDGTGTNFNFNVRYGGYYFNFAPFYDDFTGDGKADIAYVCGMLPSGGPSAVSILKGNRLIGSQFSLNLAAIVEGFYNNISNKMIVDTARVYLRNASFPFAIIDSSKGLLDSTGHGEFLFRNAMNGIPYYLVVKHRNSVETWSSVTLIFSNFALSYNFTNSVSQAYGNNLIQIDNSPLRFAIYSGDVNQDGIIDGSDLEKIDIDIQNFASGYISTDVNGDEFIDATDAQVAGNNAYNYIGKITP